MCKNKYNIPLYIQSVINYPNCIDHYKICGSFYNSIHKRRSISNIDTIIPYSIIRYGIELIIYAKK